MFPQVIEVTEFNSEVKIRAETNYLLWSMFWDCNNSDSGFSPFPLRSLYILVMDLAPV